MSSVSEIRYVGYGVPDLESERKFYRDKWGLREVAEQDGMVYFATEGGEELYVVRLRQSEERRVDVIAFACDSREDVDTLFDKVTRSGVKIIHEPRDLAQFGGGYGFRFFSPDGLPYEVSTGVEGGTSRKLVRWEAIPQRISHIVMHSPDHKAATQFFIDILGFRLSDWIGDFMSFLRCNEWHHRVAFLPGPPCLNHVAYDMLSADDMLRGISRLKKLEVYLKWGPGRHTAGDNTFSYFTTPNGFAVEYTAELERVDEASWEATTYPATPEVLDQWGIAVGGPQAMPRPEPDIGLFRPAEA